MRVISGENGWWIIAGFGRAWMPFWAAKCCEENSGRPSHIGEHGVLTADGMYALKRAGIPNLEDAATPYALTVLTTTACNLDCPYCFQNVRSRVGSISRIHRTVLNENICKSIASFLVARLQATGHQGANIILFGGEPLLNVRGCEFLLSNVNHVTKINDVMIITNGVLLDSSRFSRLVDSGLTKVQVTLDGPEFWHDKTRSTKGGKGTFKRIISNVQECIYSRDGVDWNIRVSVTRDNFEAIPSLVDELGPILTSSGNRLSISFGLIDDNGIGFESTLPLGDDYRDWLLDVYRLAIDKGFFFRPLGTIDSCVFCGVPGGKDGAVIAPDGQLYSCWETAGRPALSVGNVSTGFDSLEHVESRWTRCCDESANQFHGAASGFDVDFVDACLLDAYRRHVRAGDGYARLR